MKSAAAGNGKAVPGTAAHYAKMQIIAGPRGLRSGRILSLEKLSEKIYKKIILIPLHESENYCILLEMHL